MSAYNFNNNQYQIPDSISQFPITEVPTQISLERVKTIAQSHLQKFNDLEEIRKLIYLIRKCQTVNQLAQQMNFVKKSLQVTCCQSHCKLKEGIQEGFDRSKKITKGECWKGCWGERCCIFQGKNIQDVLTCTTCPCAFILGIGCCPIFSIYSCYFPEKSYKQKQALEMIIDLENRFKIVSKKQ